MMKFSLLVSLLLLLCRFYSALGNYFVFCGNGTYTEHVLRWDTDIVCFLSGITPSTVLWTQVTQTGQVRDLGACYNVNNCTNTGISDHLRVLWRRQASSRLTIVNVQPETAGTFICTEIRQTAVESINCTVRVFPVRIFIGTGAVTEGSSNPFIQCGISGVRTSVVNWTLATLDGRTLNLGTCYGVDENCTSPLSPDVTVSRSLAYYSYVDIRNVQREMAGTLICTDDHSTTVYSYNTTLEIVATSTPVCSIEIQRHNWSYVMSCNVTRVYSSHGRYQYEVKEVFFDPWNYSNQKTQYPFHGSRAFYPTPYIERPDNKEYYRGSFTFAWPVSRHPAEYFHLVQIHPWSSWTSMNSPRPSDFLINTPSNPTHNCSDLSKGKVMVSTQCVCHVDNLGSPEGRLLWLQGSVIIVTGEYGARQLMLSFENVDQLQIELTPVCKLDWVEPKFASYESQMSSTEATMTVSTTRTRTRTGITTSATATETTKIADESQTPSTEATMNVLTRTRTTWTTTSAATGTTQRAGEDAFNDKIQWLMMGAGAAMGIVIVTAVVVVALVKVCQRRAVASPSPPQESACPGSGRSIENSSVYAEIY